MAKNNQNLTEALKKYFGFDKFKGDQEAIIQNVLDGKDTFVSVAVVAHGWYSYCHFTTYRLDEKPG